MISLVALLWRRNCIRRSLSALSDQYENFWGSSRAQLYGEKNWWCHWSCGSAAIIFFNIKTIKNLLQNGWTDRSETLQVWSPIHEEQKVLHLWHHRSHGLGAMTFFLKNKPLKFFFSGMAWQIGGKLYPHVHQALGIPGCSQIIIMSHGLTAILDWMKIFKNDFSWTTSSITMKCHSYDLVVMWNFFIF